MCWSVTTVITAIMNDAVVDRYHSSGKAIQQVGWKVLDFQTGEEGVRRRRARTAEEDEQDLPGGLARGQAQDVLEAESQRKEDAGTEAIH